MKQLFTTVVALLALGMGVAGAQVVSVQDAMDIPASTFLEDNLLGGGVYIFNVTHNGTANISMPCVGTFETNGFEGLSMQKGVVMTTGSLDVVPSTFYGVSEGLYGYSQPSDPIIDQLLEDAGVSTTTCSIFEFDFVCLTNYISFNYTFASHEYNGFVCSSFNDMFVFMMTGPDPETGEEVTRNIATIPNTITEENPMGIAVGVNSVNSGVASTPGNEDQCTSVEYSDYYVDNKSKQGISYYGYTNKLSAEASIVPCAVYHMHISVCNAMDQSYDSGVFLEGGSFEAASAAIGLSKPGINTINGACPMYIPLTLEGTGFESGLVNITTGGSATRGVDYDLIDDDGQVVDDLFNIDLTTRNLIIKGRQNADLTVDKSIELYFNTQLCSSFPNLLVFDTQRYVMVKGTGVKVADTTLVCNHVCFEVSAPLVYGTEPIYYQWVPADGIQNPTQRVSTALIDHDATYQLIATGGSACQDDTATVKIQITNSNGDHVAIDDLQQAGIELTVQGRMLNVQAEGLQSVEVYSIDGRKVVEQTYAGTSTPVAISLQGLDEGAYGVRISTNQGQHGTKVIIK